MYGQQGVGSYGQQPGSGAQGSLGDPTSETTLVSQSLGPQPTSKQYTDYLEMQLFKTKPFGPNCILTVPKKILNLIAFHKKSRVVRNVFASSSDPDQVIPFQQSDVFMKFEYKPTEKDRGTIQTVKDDSSQMGPDGRPKSPKRDAKSLEEAINKASGLAEFWVEDNDGLLSALTHINSSMPTEVYVHVYRDSIEKEKGELQNKLLKLCSEGLIDLSKLKHDIRRRDEARRLGVALGREDNSPTSASKQEELDALLNRKRAHLGSAQSLSNANVHNVFDYYTVSELYAWLPFLSTIGEEEEQKRLSVASGSESWETVRGVGSGPAVGKAYSDATSWGGAGGEDVAMAATFVSCKTSGLKCFSKASRDANSLLNTVIPFGARFHMLVDNKDEDLRKSNAVSDALTKRKERRMKRRAQRAAGEDVTYDADTFMKVSFKETVYYVADTEDRDFVEEKEFVSIRRRMENDAIVRYYTEADLISRDVIHRMAGKVYSHALQFESVEGKVDREKSRVAWQRREDDLRRGRTRKADDAAGDEAGQWYHPHDELISVLEMLEVWTELASWEEQEEQRLASEREEAAAKLALGVVGVGVGAPSPTNGVGAPAAAQ